MMFRLYMDKLVEDTAVRVGQKTFVEAGDYPIVRVFDKDRVIVRLNPNHKDRERILTLLRIDDGEILEKGEDNGNV